LEASKVASIDAVVERWQSRIQLRSGNRIRNLQAGTRVLEKVVEQTDAFGDESA
jgi:hypothetical protein